jgi:hypothetical protein
MDDDKSKAVEVYQGTTLEAGMVQSLLQESGIEAFVVSGLMSDIAPWMASGAGTRAAAKVIVEASDYEQAVQLIADYQIRSV